mgnify:CR=1 FL=1
MPTINAKCQICGNGYHRCAKCKDIPHYKNVVDTPECFGIYCILHEYRENVINGTEATERFERLDIKYDKLIPAINGVILSKVSKFSFGKIVTI